MTIMELDNDISGLVMEVSALEKRLTLLETQVQQTTHAAVEGLQRALNKINEQQETIKRQDEDGDLIVNYFTSFMSTLDGLNKRGLLFKNESGKKSADSNDDVRKLIDTISKS